MRKSTLIVLAILTVGLVGLTLAMKYYTDQFAEEIAHARELTREFRDEEHALEPDSTVRLARAAGSPQYVIHDATTFGLLLEATPNADTWKADPRGRTLAWKMTARIFEMYTIERPVSWVQFRFLKPDGSKFPVFGLARGVGDSIVPVEPEGAK